MSSLTKNSLSQCIEVVQMLCVLPRTLCRTEALTPPIVEIMVCGWFTALSLSLGIAHHQRELFYLSLH